MHELRSTKGQAGNDTRDQRPAYSSEKNRLKLPTAMGQAMVEAMPLSEMAFACLRTASAVPMTVMLRTISRTKGEALSGGWTRYKYDSAYAGSRCGSRNIRSVWG